MNRTLATAKRTRVPWITTACTVTPTALATSAKGALLLTAATADEEEEEEEEEGEETSPAVSVGLLPPLLPAVTSKPTPPTLHDAPSSSTGCCGACVRLETDRNGGGGGGGAGGGGAAAAAGGSAPPGGGGAVSVPGDRGISTASVAPGVAPSGTLTRTLAPLGATTKMWSPTATPPGTTTSNEATAPGCPAPSPPLPPGFEGEGAATGVPRPLARARVAAASG
eukprot:COSAG01_NODE_10289_length_2199_cov_57.570952_2_plen_224_part_00